MAAHRLGWWLHARACTAHEISEPNRSGRQHTSHTKMQKSIDPGMQMHQKQLG
jgi:hypothetical protein